MESLRGNAKLRESSLRVNDVSLAHLDGCVLEIPLKRIVEKRRGIPADLSKSQSEQPHRVHSSRQRIAGFRMKSRDELPVSRYCPRSVDSR